ncbi:MAG TPA: SDR family oxidoreductase [Acidimicrobiia bacterium]
MSNVLITGGAGYIGSILTRTLLEAGHDVTVVDRLFWRGTLPEHPALTVVAGDSRLLDESDLEGRDWVIDLAAISNDPSSELFEDATWSINHRGRVRCAQLAEKVGVGRYLLASTCSVYGFHDAESRATETSPTNPLTTYAKANLAAEEGVLEIASSSFTATVVRQATVYGLSPRMRFDLAINGMTYGAWETGRLPLMRDGSQWRPMVHVRDTSEAMLHLLESDESTVAGETFNVGSEANVYQIGALGEIVAETVPGDVEIEWYGDPDHRSYRVAFDKIEATGWKAKRTAVDGVREVVAALESGETAKTPETITLDWYRTLATFRELLNEVEIDGQLLDLDGDTA